MSQVFKSFQFDALVSYYNEIVAEAEAYTKNFLEENDLEVPSFMWTPEVPEGETKLEHYRKGCEELSKIIDKYATIHLPDDERTNTRDCCILFINSSLSPLFYFSDKFEKSETSEIIGLYEIGMLDKTPIVVSPFITKTDDKIIMYNVIRNEAIKIERPPYDFTK